MGRGRVSYGRGPCRYCGQEITGNGLGRTSHYRKHVREGVLVEVETKVWDLVTDRTEYSTRFMSPAEAAKALQRQDPPFIEYRVIAGEPKESTNEH